MKRLSHATLAAVMLASCLAPACATGAADGAREPCAGKAQRIGDLGIVSLDCDCVYSSRSHSTDGRLTLVRRWTFRSEPKVGEIRADGPAAGRVREGDVITAIDGALITTREGARRFAEVAPGATITLTVRREGREIPVRIAAAAVCPESAEWPATGLLVMTPSQPPAPEMPALAPSRTPDGPARPEVAQVPEAQQASEAGREAAREAEREAERSARRIASLPKPAISTADALPRGWSGFGLTCRNCGGRPGDDGEPPVWEFGTLPTIYFLDPGSPAARAGIQIGDVLTHLDGVSLLTEEGGRRFGALKPAQSVRWTIRRGGRVLTATMVPAQRPEQLPLAELQAKLQALSENRDALRMSSEMQRMAREMAHSSLRMAREASRDRLRYAGAVGGSEVEVRGLENVVVDDSGDEIVITTRDATIRIRKAATTAPHPTPRAGGSR